MSNSRKLEENKMNTRKVKGFTIPINTFDNWNQFRPYGFYEPANENKNKNENKESVK